jgi:hypothetical protein
VLIEPLVPAVVDPEVVCPPVVVAPAEVVVLLAVLLLCPPLVVVGPPLLDVVVPAGMQTASRHTCPAPQAG